MSAWHIASQCDRARVSNSLRCEFSFALLSFRFRLLTCDTILLEFQRLSSAELVLLTLLTIGLLTTKQLLLLATLENENDKK
jgi:hypothetical protein